MVRVSGRYPSLKTLARTEKAKVIWRRWVKQLTRTLRVTRLGLIFRSSKRLKREIAVGQCLILTREAKILLNWEMCGVGRSWSMQLNKTTASIGLWN